MNTLRSVLEEKKSELPKEFVLDTYNDLLLLLAGYIFEVNAGLALDSEEKAKGT